jgi:hypothetical protein
MARQGSGTKVAITVACASKVTTRIPLKRALEMFTNARVWSWDLRGTNVAAAVCAMAALSFPILASAQEGSPANTLMDLRRQFGACLAGTPFDAAGSRVTIVFMMKRDGSIFGKPRITYSHLEGDAAARQRFVDDAARAVDSCLPLKVTPALGGAIAGRMFSITLGRSKPESGA